MQARQAVAIYKKTQYSVKFTSIEISSEFESKFKTHTLLLLLLRSLSTVCIKWNKWIIWFEYATHDENNDVIDFVQFDRWFGIKVYSKRTERKKNHGQRRRITHIEMKRKKINSIRKKIFEFRWYIALSVHVNFAVSLTCVWKLIHL